MEDLNHEVYGGLYSQMIFGESFQEPTSSQQLDDFECIGNSLRTDGQVASFLHGCARSALVARSVQVGSGTVAVDVRLSDETSGIAGILFKADSHAQKGKIPSGYTVLISHDEVRLNGQNLKLARFPHKTPSNTWTRLETSFEGNHISIKLDGQPIGEFTDTAPAPSNHADAAGVYNEYQPASYRDFTITVNSKTQVLSFKSPESSPPVVSDMWVPVQEGAAKGHHEPLGIPSEISPSQTGLDAVAERSADGATLVLRVVNTQAKDIETTLLLDGFKASDVQATQIKGDLKAENP